ncbi:hypothetical protein [Mesomycoplasma ovipneumoniae]|uniref:hypothetical protein n=1 Tax=Mesomycoplasma ovipneumoniae TaxID=29562 RepID=UPI0030808F7B
MANIFDLEVNNLTKKQKEYWLDFLTDWAPERMKEAQRWVEWSENVEKSKKSDLLGKTLKKYFADNADEFVLWQKSYKNSLYNQVIKENDFKDLDYKDMIKNLTQDQKNSIIDSISSLTKYLKPKCTENCDKYYDNDGFNNYYDYGAPYLLENTPENQKIIEKEETINEELKQYWEKNKNEKYVLVWPKESSKTNQTDLRFFSDDDRLITYALLARPDVFANPLAFWHKEYLNPHYKVNNWMVTNHELELAQKDDLEQTQKFEEPKMKM